MAEALADMLPLEIDGHAVGTLLKISGSMKSDSSGNVHSALDSILKGEVKNVLVDLEGATETDNLEITVLRGYADTYQSSRGYFALVNVSDSFKNALQESNLADVFSSFADVESASQAFAKMVHIHEEVEHKGEREKRLEEIDKKNHEAALKKGTAPEAEAPEKESPSKSFPKQAACPNCKVELTLPQAGRFKCTRCGEAFSAEPTGRLRNLGMRENVYFQMTVPAHKDYVDGIKLMVENTARRLYLSVEDSRKAGEAIGEVCSLIIAHADDSSGRALFQLLFVAEGGRFVIKTSDTGRKFNLEDDNIKTDPRLKTAQSIMDVLEYKPHPKQGNIVTIAKKLPKVV